MKKPIGSATTILIMNEMGTPGDGTRPASGRCFGRCRPGALTRRPHLVHNENCWPGNQNQP
ncbi:MAG: hypothetical protein NT154_18920, partial [Verrucomicrobia bacterium]|nr:hypothetical protein [Verrucomicrobiota bacterium]